MALTEDELLMYSELEIDSRKLLEYISDLAREDGISTDFYVLFREGDKVWFGIKDEMVEALGSMFEKRGMAEQWKTLMEGSEYREDS